MRNNRRDASNTNNRNWRNKVSKIGGVRQEPFGIEELQDMNDDRVLGLRGHLQNNINALRRQDQTSGTRVEIRRLEVELCYVHREAEVRQKRKALHIEYVRQRNERRDNRRSRSRGHHENRGPRGPGQGHRREA